MTCPECGLAGEVYQFERDGWWRACPNGHRWFGPRPSATEAANRGREAALRNLARQSGGTCGVCGRALTRHGACVFCGPYACELCDFTGNLPAFEAHLQRSGHAIGEGEPEEGLTTGRAAAPSCRRSP